MRCSVSFVVTFRNLGKLGNGGTTVHWRLHSTNDYSTTAIHIFAVGAVGGSSIVIVWHGPLPCCRWQYRLLSHQTLNRQLSVGIGWPVEKCGKNRVAHWLMVHCPVRQCLAFFWHKRFFHTCGVWCIKLIRYVPYTWVTWHRIPETLRGKSNDRDSCCIFTELTGWVGLCTMHQGVALDRSCVGCSIFDANAQLGWIQHGKTHTYQNHILTQTNTLMHVSHVSESIVKLLTFFAISFLAWAW